MNNTVINISNVMDYSSEPSTVTYSNPVTTVINRPDPPSVGRRYIRQVICEPCRCCLGIRLLCMCQNRCRRRCDECTRTECAFRQLNF